jgi:hypothetical protein
VEREEKKTELKGKQENSSEDALLYCRRLFLAALRAFGLFELKHCTVIPCFLFYFLLRFRVSSILPPLSLNPIPVHFFFTAMPQRPFDQRAKERVGSCARIQKRLTSASPDADT